MPIIGRIPRDIPILTNIWKKRKKAKPEAKSRTKLFSEFRAILIILKRRIKKARKRTDTPKRPVSSTRDEKIKLV